MPARELLAVWIVVLMGTTVVLGRPQQQQFQQPQQQQFQQPQQQQTAKPIAILSQNRQFNEDGSSTFDFETEDGIRVQQGLTLKTLPPSPHNKGAGAEGEGEGGPVLVAQGSFSYTAPDGTPIHLTYIADENGFQPQGDHLPTPPPIPEAIQRALDFIASQPQQPDQDHN